MKLFVIILSHRIPIRWNFTLWKLSILLILISHRCTTTVDALRCDEMWWQDLTGRRNGYMCCIMCMFIAYLFTLKYSFNRIRLFTVENQIIFPFATSSSLYIDLAIVIIVSYPFILRFASSEFRWLSAFRLCFVGVWSWKGASVLIIYALAQCDNGNVEQT